MPQSKNIVKRQRLFKELNAARKTNSAIWISAPAGTGKTTLVTSYLQQKKVKPLWYQIDEGDADTASFFYYLGIAGKEKSTTHRDFPQLTPEYLLGVPTFTRNFFRQLYGELTLPGVLVFDNYQDVASDAALHELLMLAMTELPDKLTIIIISRVDPPPVFSKLKLSQKMMQLGFDSLSLTPEESKAVALLQTKKQNKKLDEKTLQSLHAKTQGWTAGLILYLQQTQINPEIETTQRDLDPQSIFDYFAGELFSQTDEDTQNVLLKTAFFPSINIQSAKTITDNPNAQNVLENLCRRNYFIVRHSGAVPSYEYHPLFRAFLQAKAEIILTPSTLLDLQRQTAKLLSETDHIDEAANLSIKTEDWPSLIGLIVTQAQNMLVAGKWQTLLRWINTLPKEIVQQQPWLLFWLASATMATDLFTARNYYKDALVLFIEQNDAVGSYLAWSGGVDTFNYLWIDFAPLDEWLDIFSQLQQQFPEFPGIEVEARATYAMLSACLWRRPDKPDMVEWADRAENLLLQDFESNSKLMMGCYLLLYYLWWQGNLHRINVIFEKVKAVAEHKKVNLLPKLFWHVIESCNAYLHNNSDFAIEIAHRGLQLADKTGVIHMKLLTHAQAVYGFLTKFDYIGAEEELKQIEALLQNTETFDYAHYHYLAAWIELNKGNSKSAEEHANIALNSALKIQASCYLPFGRIALAQAYYEGGDFANAFLVGKEALQWGREVGDSYIDCNYFNLNAYHALLENNLEEFKYYMARAMEISKENNHIMTPWCGWRLPIMRSIYTEALNQNIETDYVSFLIRQRKIPPPTDTAVPDNWPFPIKIYTLGRFSLLIDGEAQALTAQSAQKPMELLKCLIAMGARQVSQEKITEFLWPDAEGDSARRNFDTTLFRLRKLLKHDQALVLKEGLLSLNSSYVWVDHWTLEILLSQLDKFKKRVDHSEILSLQEKLVELYKGDFLSTEADRSWSIVLKERLRDRMLKCLLQIGDVWQQQKQFSEAEVCYEKGLALDPLHEPYYQQLIQLYISQNKNAQATAIYEKCRKIFSTKLGVMPSEQTMQLYKQIL